MKLMSLLLVTGLLALAGCGGDDGGSDSGSPASGTNTDANAETSPSADTAGDGAAAERGSREGGDGASKATGTKVALGDSDFGRMLFDSSNQAIYIFERDARNRSNCYGECADAWPPVFTDGEPRAGEGVDASLLGTTKRRDGKRQVTYDGKPLYYYANEGRGEVKCHNVNLNGGFWWVVGADGERLQ